MMSRRTPSSSPSLLRGLGLTIGLAAIIGGGLGAPTATAAPVVETLGYRVVPSPGLPKSQSASPGKVSLRVKLVAKGLVNPVFVTSAPDGVSRMFVVEQPGRIKIYGNGKVRSKPYLSIRNRVLDGGERGMLGLAFSPSFKTDKHFWVSYTDSAGALQVSRFTARSAKSNRARRGSEVKVIRVPHPGQANHNGGMLAFGKDGKLYISTGDGGGGGDPYANAQDRKSKSGKILRINPRKFCGTKHYCIPKSNPYAKPGGALAAIWAYGLRNTWRFSVDRVTGDLWLADVGQDQWEEVTRMPSGKKAWNLGWSCREARTVYNASRCKAKATYHDPTIAYSHAVGESITGGYVYRGSKYASQLHGLYVFGDFITGNLWVFGKGKKVLVGNVGAYRLSSFGESAKGELWATTLDGQLHKVVASAAR